MASTRGPDSRLVDAIRRADSSAVRDALARLRSGGTFRDGQWLPSGNGYADNAARNVADHARAGTLDGRDLAEYMAVSAFLHSADGWGYLARASHAHAVGDEPVAVHLAYYAELRAAAALLATQGFALLNQWHVALDATGACLAGPGRTHDAAWYALREWSTTPAAREVVCSVVIAGGVALRMWLDALCPGVSATAVAAELVGHAGLDIRLLSEDSLRRNEASYRPCALKWGTPADARDVARSLGQTWLALEPRPGSAFESLDREIIRATLPEVFHASVWPRLEAAGHHDEAAAFSDHVGRVTYEVSPSGMPREEWCRFLTTPRACEVLTEARKTDAVGTPSQHRQVMARATLLLRFATGACQALARDAGCTWADFRFWWGRLGFERAIWDDGCEPADMCDLWADVSVAIEDLTDWDAGLGEAAPSPARLHRDQAPALCALVQMERAMLWGLAT